jgi:hypothetical protein
MIFALNNLWKFLCNPIKIKNINITVAERIDNNE